MAHPRLTAEIGRVLGGRYRLITPIGMGASAQVYLADDVKLRRRVAVKMLHDALAGEVDFLRRFRAEARAAAALSHPNVMAVYDWSDGETPFLVTEYLPGGSLRALLDHDVLLSPAQALNIGLQAARALDYAHRRGFVHRDIKPANLLFGEDQRLRIADFGLARALAEAAWTEPQGAVLGTARYAAPEQAKGESLTGRSDVYALALVLVEAVTGTVPFVADTTLGTLMARVDRPLVVPDELGPLQAILTEAGHADPANRIDARGLALGLLGAAQALTRPQPMALPGAMVTGQLYAIDADPTDQGLVQPVVPDGWPLAADAASDLQAGDLGLDPPAWVSSGAASTVDAAAGQEGDAEAFVPGGHGPTESVPVTPPPGQEPVAATGPDAPSGATAAGGEADPEPDVEVDLTDAAVAAPVWGGSSVTQDPTTEAEPAARPKLIRVDSAVISPSAGGRDQRAAEPAAAAADAGADDGQVDRSHRRRWPWALLVLVLLAGGGVAAALVARDGSGTSSSQAADLPVPDTGGLTAAQARSLLEAGGWKVKESTTRRDGTAAGQLLEVSPRAGARLAAGRTVSLLVSVGQSIVAVPDGLVGRPYPEAQLLLVAAGLVGTEADTPYDEDAAAGQVLAIAPGTAATLEKGATVGLVVSKGPKPRVVPSGLIGATEAPATAAVEDVQLRLETVRVYNDEAPVGQIVAVSPRPGSTVARGSTVKVQVSLGPELKAVPSVAGAADLQGAVAILRNAGFAAGNTSGPAAGKPTGTSPSAGTEVKPGSTINIILG